MEIRRDRCSLAIDADTLAARLAPYDSILIDVGTGDGRYPLYAARTDPACFALGLDACRENLRAASRIAPANALFVIANALALPDELAGLAGHVAVNFPWGSLLDGLLDGNSSLLHGLAAIARPHALLEIHLNGGALAEAGWSLQTGATCIQAALCAGGFTVERLEELDARALRRCPTTWARRLAHGRDPRGVYLRARAAGSMNTGGMRDG